MISLAQKIEIIEFITTNFGTMLNVEQWFELESKIKNSCLELHIGNWEDFATSIPGMDPNSKELETLACQLSISETYFFRETKALDYFKTDIVPTLLKSRSNNKSITIWSAGCGSGEEPYTLAMILKENIPNIENWNIKIFATDINSHFLDKAAKGTYSPWSFKNTPDWAMKKYFRRVDNAFEIDESIKKMVNFSRINLVDDSAFPSTNIKPWSVDVIFCRNVFSHFPTNQIKNISQRFKRCLTEEGWLITSPIEASSDGLKSLRYEWHPGVAVLRKDSSYKDEIQETSCKCTKEDAIQTNYSNANYLIREHKKDTIGKLYSKAQKFFKDGQYCLASTYIKDILKERRNNADALVLQAKIFANLGDYNGAVVILKNLIKQTNNNPTLHYLLASMHAELQQQDLAEKSLIQALQLQPDMISAQFLMGNIMHSQGNSRTARKYFTNIKKLINEQPEKEPIPELDGMTTGALAEIISCIVE